MAGRSLLALMALLALLFAGLHPAAMAGTMAQPVIQADVESAAPCHQDAAPKPVKTEKPANAECCPSGCDGQCTSAAAFFAAPAAKVMAFLRAVVDAPALARAPDAAIHAPERPPRPLA